MPHYLPTREGNAQSRDTFRLCQKMEDGTPRRLCMFHSYLNMANFCGDGTDHFRFSAKQTWKSIWNKHNITAWGGPISISSLAVKLLLESIYCLVFSGEIAVHIQRYFLLLFTSLPFYEFVEKIDWQMVKYKP